MNVRKLYYAKAIELFRQPVQSDSFVLDAEHVGLRESSTRYMGQAQSEGTQRCFRSIRTAIRRDTSTLVPSNRGRHLFAWFDANLPGKRQLSGAHYRDLRKGTQLANWDG